jgi:hypothetical protein
MTPTDGTYRLKRSLATRRKRGLNLPRGPAAVKLGLARAVIERGGPVRDLVPDTFQYSSMLRAGLLHGA